MKLLFSVLLITLAVACNSAVLPNDSSRANLIVGTVRPGDRELQRSFLYLQARPNQIQSRTYSYHGIFRISAVQVTEVGFTQRASPRIISGGVGFYSVTVRVDSARGYGFNYDIRIFGR